MKKLFTVIFLAVFVFAGWQFLGNNNGKSISNNKIEVAKQVSPPREKSQSQEVEKNPAIPKTIRIPTLNVEAIIEPVGMDNEGRMDVPKDADNVSWYRLGYHPGAKGSAVFAGHFDKVSGEPAVFSEIKKLVAGEEVIVTDANGSDYTFVVTRSESYAYDKLPMQEIFGAASSPRLNLITCHGVWNSETKNYSQRMVVYTKLK